MGFNSSGPFTASNKHEGRKREIMKNQINCTKTDTSKRV